MKPNQIGKEAYEMLGNLQNSLHSAVQVFTALERKHDEIGRVQKMLLDHIVREMGLINLLLSRQNAHYENIKNYSTHIAIYLCNTDHDVFMKVTCTCKGG